MHRILRAMKRECGATAVEYAVIASTIAAVVVSATVLLGGHTMALFQSLLAVWLVQ